MSIVDCFFIDLVENALSGDRIEGRNHPTFSTLFANWPVFKETPLVTVRKTAWKKALVEMEWFLTGNAACPTEIMDWWDGQLNPQGLYRRGYAYQLRYFGGQFDQINHLLQSIRRYPYSRRHILTTWNPEDMSKIAEINENPHTPATCHTSFNQYFVRNGELHGKTYQRSADILLGVPHNWIQQWALLLWIAAQTGLKPGLLGWEAGDAHIYDDPTHLDVARAMVDAPPRRVEPLPELVYHGGPDTAFFADDFEMVGDIPEPVTTLRPKRF